MHLASIASALAAAAAVLAVSPARMAADRLASAASMPSSNASSIVYAPGKYTVTIYNSDCPCKRDHLRFCTRFMRRSVVAHRCYTVSHYVRAMRVHDPLVSDAHQLLCNVYMSPKCDGPGMEMAFVDNTLCREPQYDVTKKMRYRSFVCRHRQLTGWPGASSVGV